MPRKRRAGSAALLREPREARQDSSHADSHVTVREQQSNGGEGKYVGLSGTDDVYWVAERNQAIGNDPAREAYFRVCNGGSRISRSLLINSQ